MYFANQKNCNVEWDNWVLIDAKSLLIEPQAFSSCGIAIPNGPFH